MPSQPPPLPSDANAEPSRAASVRKTVLIVLGVLVGIVLLLAALIGAYLYFAKELPVEDRDKQVVVQASDFVGWLEDFEVDPAAETWTKLRNIDGSHELDYEYDAEDLYISCTVSVERNASDAKMAYIGSMKGSEIAVSLEDGSVKADDLLRYGDESDSMVIDFGAGPAGNLIGVRKGARTFIVLWTGTYFDDAESLRDLLLPVLERWSRYRP